MPKDAQKKKATKRVSNTATSSVRNVLAEHHKFAAANMATADTHEEQWSIALKRPFEAESPYIPLAQDSMPCKSKKIPVTGLLDYTIPTSAVRVKLYLYPDGMVGDYAGVGPGLADRCVPVFTAGPSYRLGGPPDTVNPQSAIGFFETFPDTVNNSLIPVGPPTPGYIMVNDVPSMLVPNHSGGSPGIPPQSRLVAAGLKVSFAGRQSDIEGNVVSICPYEMPAAQGALPTMGTFRTDDSYRDRSIDADRMATVRFWPNCETPLYRVYTNAGVTPAFTNQPPRHVVFLDNVQQGDKIRLEWICHYEVVTAAWNSISSVSPLSSVPAHTANAVMTSAGRNASLSAHIHAHKILSTPSLRTLPIAQHAAKAITKPEGILDRARIVGERVLENSAKKLGNFALNYAEKQLGSLLSAPAA